MDFSRRIAHLEEAHAMLERELEKASANGSADSVVIDIKKKKLHTKDLIIKLIQEHVLNNSGKEFK